MLTAIYEMIISRITGLNLFATVGSALTSEPGALPAAEVWLAEDNGATDSPTVTRRLSWVVRLTVSHEDEAGASQEAMFELLDALRGAFVGWTPTDYIGVKRWWQVPQIKIESYKDHGSLVYLLGLDVEIFPQTFKANP